MIFLRKPTQLGHSLGLCYLETCYQYSSKPGGSLRKIATVCLADVPSALEKLMNPKHPGLQGIPCVSSTALLSCFQSQDYSTMKGDVDARDKHSIAQSCTEHIHKGRGQRQEK